MTMGKPPAPWVYFLANDFKLNKKNSEEYWSFKDIAEGAGATVPAVQRFFTRNKPGEETYIFEPGESGKITKFVQLIEVIRIARLVVSNYESKKPKSKVTPFGSARKNKFPCEKLAEIELSEMQDRADEYQAYSRDELKKELKDAGIRRRNRK